MTVNKPLPERMRPDDLDVGTTVPEMLEADLRLEYKVRAALCKGIELCGVELHGWLEILTDR